jgi:anti-sigma factor RsiW
MFSDIPNGGFMETFDQDFDELMEDFICRYAEGDLDKTELSAFRELMDQRADVQRLAEASKAGKQYLDSLLRFPAIL